METLALVLATALVNGLVTWGVVKTELRWLRRDVDLAHLRIDRIDALHVRKAERGA